MANVLGITDQEYALLQQMLPGVDLTSPQNMPQVKAIMDNMNITPTQPVSTMVQPLTNGVDTTPVAAKSYFAPKQPITGSIPSVTDNMNNAMDAANKQLATQTGPTVQNAESQFGPNGSLAELNQAKAGYYRGLTEDLNKTPWGEYANIGFGGLQGLMNVASYFDNRELGKAQLDSINTNIKIARDEAKHRKAFREGTTSAFA